MKSKELTNHKRLTIHYSCSVVLANGREFWSHFVTAWGCGERRMNRVSAGPTVLIAFVLLLVTAFGSSADAASQTRKRVPRPAPTPKDAALIVDATSGRILYKHNADAARHPASLTKMMTLYLLFEAVESGKMTMQTQMAVSPWAASQSPTKLDLKPGETIDVDTAIRAIVIRSANDVAVVIGEALGGTESAFASMMDAKARDLGMWRTNFENASGLPDLRQVTTASDMARLGRRLAYDFPQHFHYFSLNDFTYRGRRYETHNNLIGVFAGAEGIKTGYTRMSGFNLVTSAVRNNKHLMGVVMGGATAVGRDREMMRLLGIAFGEAEKNPLLVAHANVPWQDGAGEKTTPNWDAPLPQKIELAAFEPGAGITAATIEVAAIKTPAPKAVVTASLTPPLPKAALRATAETATPRPRPQTPAASPTVVAKNDSAIEQGDVGGPALQPSDAAKRWTVQIGAYGNRTLAMAELNKYAKRSSDVLGKAQQLVSITANPAGGTVYRARFGLFSETEARAVCKRISAQGATCFATLQKS